MQHRIIQGSTAIKTINDLLKDEKNRLPKIALFNIDEVNLYIDTVKAMRADLDKILNCSLARVDVGACRAEETDFDVIYNDYTFNIKKIKRGVFRVSVDPQPPFEALKNLLLELLQQKRHLEKLEKLQDKLYQKLAIHNPAKEMPVFSVNLGREMSGSLDDSDAKEEKQAEHLKVDAELVKKSMIDAQDKVALQVLQSYDDLADQYKKLTEEFKVVELKETQKSVLLDDSLSQNEKLHKDIRQLQSQLAELRIEYKRVNEASVNEAQRIKEATTVAQTQIAEQKSELTRLKQQEPLTLNIKRDHFVDLINKFSHSSSFSLFSSSAIDHTFKNLKKLSELKKENIVIKEIISCIKDPDLLKIFNNPYVCHDTRLLSKTGLIVRELAFIFREPQLLPKVAHQ